LETCELSELHSVLRRH